MANNNPENQFGKDKQPKNRRGKAERTKILEAMARQSKTEEEFYDYLVTRAFNPEDNFGAPELLKRLYPIPKATMPMVDFEFDENASPNVQASQVMKAVSDGLIAPDSGQMFISSIASMLKIEEVTEIKDRLDKIEEALNGNS